MPLTTKKYLLLLLSICACSFYCIAQTFPVERDRPAFRDAGMSFKELNNNLNKFAGTWEYQDGTRKLTVVLQEIADFEIGSALSDVIVGNYIYEENGVEIINTLTNPSPSQGSDDIYHIEMFGFRDSSEILGFVQDPIRSKWTLYSLYLDYQPATRENPRPQLEWSTRIREFYNPDGDVDAAQALRVPRLLTLTKI